MRIQKYFSEQGILSRRETEKAIQEGRVVCNGKVVHDLGRQIDPGHDIIQLRATTHETKITIALNKPKGIVCSRSSHEGKTVFQAFPQFSRLNVVGRLDKESEGLLLLSNDGAITSAVTGEHHIVEKEYEVVVQESLVPAQLKRLAEGVVLEDGPTLPAKVTRINKNTFVITLKEGRKHQIRRMAAAVRLTIKRLKRIRIGDISLDRLRQGESRSLTQEEVTNLKKSGLKN